MAKLDVQVPPAIWQELAIVVRQEHFGSRILIAWQARAAFKAKKVSAKLFLDTS